MDNDSRPRRLRDVASVIAGVPLTGVGDVQTADGPVRQQVRFHAVIFVAMQKIKKKKEIKKKTKSYYYIHIKRSVIESDVQ